MFSPSRQGAWRFLFSGDFLGGLTAAFRGPDAEYSAISSQCREYWPLRSLSRPDAITIAPSSQSFGFPVILSRASGQMTASMVPPSSSSVIVMNFFCSLVYRSRALEICPRSVTGLPTRSSPIWSREVTLSPTSNWASSSSGL